MTHTAGKGRIVHLTKEQFAVLEKWIQQKKDFIEKIRKEYRERKIKSKVMVTFIVNGTETSVEPQSTVRETAEIALAQTGTVRQLHEFHLIYNEKQINPDWSINDLPSYGVILTETEPIFISLRAGVGG